MNYTSEYDNKFIIDSDSDSDSDSELAEELSKKCIISSFPEYYKAILSIDIGIIHLGITVSLIDESYNIQEVIWVDLIDITQFKCEDDCDLWHQKTFSDWLSHVFKNEYHFFNDVDVILVERQPITGITVVEQLIFYEWRNKAILISPRSMHKFFNIGHLDYDARKVFTENKARQIIKDPVLNQQLNYFDRIHDIGDSICICLFWLNRQKEILEKERKRKEIMDRNMFLIKARQTMSIEEWFNHHKYNIVNS
jgi:hypothetical protein